MYTHMHGTMYMYMYKLGCCLEKVFPSQKYGPLFVDTRTCHVRILYILIHIHVYISTCAHMID